MRRRARQAIAAPIMLLAALLLGCVAQGGHVRATAVYGVGYYGPVGPPFGVWGPRYYGVWGPRYRVAPPRARVHVGAVRGRRPPHAFRAAPIGRPVPSIPRRRKPLPRRVSAARSGAWTYRFDDRACACELAVAATDPPVTTGR